MAAGLHSGSAPGESRHCRAGVRSAGASLERGRPGLGFRRCSVAPAPALGAESIRGPRPDPTGIGKSKSVPRPTYATEEQNVLPASAHARANKTKTTTNMKVAAGGTNTCPNKCLPRRVFEHPSQDRCRKHIHFSARQRRPHYARAGQWSSFAGPASALICLCSAGEVIGGRPFSARCLVMSPIGLWESNIAFRVQCVSCQLGMAQACLCAWVTLR